MFRLIEMHRRAEAHTLHNFGAAMALAYHEPQRLKEIIKPKPSVNLEDLPAMLRPVKKKADDG